MNKTLLQMIPVAAVVLLVAAAGCTGAPAGGTPSPSAPATAAMTTTAPAGGTPSPSAPATAAVTTAATTAAPAGNGTLQTAEKGDTVAIFYTGMFENGTVFDTNMNGTTPVRFTLGSGLVIDGIEEAVTGMSPGQQKTVIIPAEKAYGAYNASLIHTVNRTGPIANTTFVEGQYVSIHDRTTNLNSTVKILNVTSSTVTWDANNPLAGINFTFTIKLDGISRP